MPVALRLELAGNRQQCWEYAECPADILDLQELVVENNLTNGEAFQLMLAERRLSQQDLDEHDYAEGPLVVQVAVTARRSSWIVKAVVLGTTPLQKLELQAFPEDLPSLESLISQSLTNFSRTFSLHVDGELLTQERFAALRQNGTRLLVQVKLGHDPNARPRAGRSATPEVDPRRAAFESFPDVFGDMVNRASAAMAHCPLVEVARAHRDVSVQVQQDIDAISSKYGTASAKDARDLLAKMGKAFSSDFEHILKTRGRVELIHSCTLGLADALVSGNYDSARKQLWLMKTTADDMSKAALAHGAATGALSREIGDAVEKYNSARFKYKVGSGVCATGSAACTALSIGGGVAAVAHGAGAAAVLGSVETFAVTALGTVGVTSVGGAVAASLLTGGVAVGCFAAALLLYSLSTSSGKLRDQCGDMQKMAMSLQGAADQQSQFWTGIQACSEAAEQALKDVELYGEFAREAPGPMRTALRTAAQSLSLLEENLDQFLVFASASPHVPTRIDVRPLIGAERVSRIERLLKIGDTAASGSGAA